MDQSHLKQAARLTGVNKKTALAHHSGKTPAPEITFIPVGEEVLVPGMIESELPEPIAGRKASFDAAMKIGLCGPAKDAVKKLTCQEPQSVRTFFDENKEPLTNPSHERGD